MDQGQIIEKPANHTEELKPYFACNREFLWVFMLWCEKVSVNMCKVLFTQSISEAQIFQVKHHQEKNIFKVRVQELIWGEGGEWAAVHK